MTKMYKIFAGLLATLSLALGGAVHAQQSNPITFNSYVEAVEEVQNADGSTSEQRAKPGTIVPGTRLIMGTSYQSHVDRAIENIKLTNPLSEAVQLAADADPALIVSVDGGKQFGVLAELSVSQADGTSRPATHADVTHVKVSIPSIGPRESGKVEYPVVVK